MCESVSSFAIAPPLIGTSLCRQGLDQVQRRLSVNHSIQLESCSLKKCAPLRLSALLAPEKGHHLDIDQLGRMRGGITRDNGLGQDQLSMRWNHRPNRS